MFASREDLDNISFAVPSTPRGSVYSPPIRHEMAPEVLQPWRYLMRTPGKNVRSMLIDGFNSFLEVDKPTLTLLKQITGYLHSSSLLIDDIEDGSKLRRGISAAHHVFGMPLTLNAGNYVYFLALEKVIGLNDPECISIFTEELLNLHRGQGRDILWRERCPDIIPTMEEYREMILDKTGGLFRLAIRLMYQFRRRLDIEEGELIDLCNDLAEYFQVRDDAINLCSPEYHKNKSFCEDLTEGKMSYPILCALSRLNEKEKGRILEILTMHTEDFDLKKEALGILRRCGALDATIDHTCRLEKRCISRIQKLGGCTSLERIMFRLRGEIDVSIAAEREIAAAAAA